MPSEKQIEAFARYRRKQIAELRPYIEGEDVSHVSISPEDAKAGSPRVGDMIARNQKNHADQWLVARAYFLDNFEALTAAEQAEPAQGVKVKALEWSEHRTPNEDRPYDHVVAESIFGRWTIEWKSWKECDDYTIFLDGDFVDNGGWRTLEAAKELAFSNYKRRILSALVPAEPATDAEPYLWLHPWNGSTSKHRSGIAVDCPKDGPQPIPLFTRPPEPEGNAQPWGYWVKHKYAEGGFLRTPCFTPEADYYTDVIPLYTRPTPSEARLREAAQRVVDRWDTPHWKNAVATAIVVNDLRAALKEASDERAQDDGR